MAVPRKILLLGGTGEARLAAAELVARGYGVIYSIAGVTSAPNLPDTQIHTGGFGGVGGLEKYIADHRIDCLVDATHPFAETMTRNAQAVKSVPVIHLVRDPWLPEPDDKWQSVPDLDSCVETLGGMSSSQNIFLALGAKYLSRFYTLDQKFIARMIELPEETCPQNFNIVRQGPPYDLRSELALLKLHRIDLLVTRNSGTDASWPKIEAARALGIPVLVIDQPAPPPGITCRAAQLVDCLSQTLAPDPGKSHMS